MGTATFYADDDTTVLSTQSFDGVGIGAGANGLFGHIATDGDTIGKIKLNVTFPGDDYQITVGMDDLGFAAIPEPSTWTLVVGAFGLLFLFRRRR